MEKQVFCLLLNSLGNGKNAEKGGDSRQIGWSQEEPIRIWDWYYHFPRLDLWGERPKLP
jgi:hypothetical protein